MANLELVDTDDLLHELEKRFDSSVFCGAQELNNGSRKVSTRWDGDGLICVALAGLLAKRCLASWDKETLCSSESEE
jgi:hypothetical protein